MTIKRILLALYFITIINLVKAQDSIPWHHYSSTNSEFRGISLQEGLDFMKEKGRVQKTVIVAVIDSGIDTLHEDLRARLWHNPNEIPYNNKDDDGNGYIDDYYGWNFIGGANGKNIDGETLELVRFYKAYKDKFDNKKKSNIAKQDKKLFKRWLIAEAEINKEITEYQQQKDSYTEWGVTLKYCEAFIKNRLQIDTLTTDDVSKFEPKNKNEEQIKNLVLETYAEDISTKEIDEAIDYFNDNLNKNYSLTFDPRPEIIGDNPADITDTIYGNNDVQAKGYSHGTGVSGLIGAVRNNGIGTQGIVDSVQLMILRVVPGGDERDKDVALAIRYAVKNGAKIINGSFGKSYSMNPEFVKKAIDYAVANDVLIIHAAGNESEDNDKTIHYPTPTSNQRSHWIDVAATGRNNKDFHLAADFTNYGRKSVDLFAPGVDTYSTAPNNRYDASSGTSNASPVAAGVAALVKAYYPNISAEQLRTVLIDSSIKHSKTKTYKPGSTKKKVKFKKLSTSAGIVNAYEALKMADELLKVNE